MVLLVRATIELIPPLSPHMYSGLKVDLATGTDLSEANTLGFKTDYIDIKSNSWGPSDFGYIVSGPGTLVQQALETAAKEVEGVFKPITVVNMD